MNRHASDAPRADANRVSTCVQFIREEALSIGMPWCYNVGFTAPQPAFVAQGKYWDMYPREHGDLPQGKGEHLESQHLMLQEQHHFKHIATPISEQRIRNALAGYCGLITELDEHIGQIRTALEDAGVLANTFFVYTSDYCEARGDHGLWLRTTYSNHPPSSLW